ncbi:TPA: hypothetical protein ACF6NJ_004649, partial [Salmonella enterica subsp. enterica serovar Sandiego]
MCRPLKTGTAGLRCCGLTITRTSGGRSSRKAAHSQAAAGRWKRRLIAIFRRLVQWMRQHAPGVAESGCWTRRM